MPKVSKISIEIKGQKQVFDIFFNSKEHFHIKNFPEEIIRVTSVVIDGQSTLDMLIKVIKEAVDKYHQISKTQRKVIVYRMMLSSAMYMNRDGNHMGSNSYMGYQQWVPDSVRGGDGKIKSTPFRSMEYTIGLEYRIYMETQLARKQYFQINNEGTLNHETHEDSLRGWFIIDWTEERENSLENITKGMTSLAQKMGEILLNPEIIGIKYQIDKLEMDLYSNFLEKHKPGSKLYKKVSAFLKANDLHHRSPLKSLKKEYLHDFLDRFFQENPNELNNI